LKNLIIKYKSVIKFILTFLAVYLFLSYTYKLYLDYSDGTIYYPDYITNLVARQNDLILGSLDYRANSIPHPYEPSMKVIVNEKYVARIIEGCNSVSVIILFAAFIIAFASEFKLTFFYILAGSALIWGINLFRITILVIGLYNYPWRRDTLHSVIFPLIIYGFVFLLWMLWVNRFSKVQKTNA